MKIKTDYVFPPIPIRQFDWCAYDDDTYDGPGSLIGHGATEQEAIADFQEQWNEKYGDIDDDGRIAAANEFFENTQARSNLRHT